MMSLLKDDMKIGIIGPPQSGKTTVFKLLLQKETLGDVGIFNVSDERVDKLAISLSSKKKTYPELTIIDIGSTSDLSKKDLSRLSDVDLFISVIGSFFSDDPKKDLDGIITDILLLDLDIIQNRLDKIKKDEKAVGVKQELAVLEKYKEIVSEGKLLCKVELDKEERKILTNLTLLSLKHMILAINMSEKEGIKEKVKCLEDYSFSKDVQYIKFFGDTELELLKLSHEEKEKFLVELGPGYNFKEEISKCISRELGLITFFTAGEKETKGWFLRSGLSVLEAAGKIHSDIKKGFIRAEIMNYEDFVKCGSEYKVRESGLLKVEGKDYIVRDGDIINVRFSV